MKFWRQYFSEKDISEKISFEFDFISNEKQTPL